MISYPQPVYYPKEYPGVPFCSQDECCHYDGKRCDLLGRRPESVCQPQVARMGAKLAIYENAVEELAKKIKETNK